MTQEVGCWPTPWFHWQTVAVGLGAASEDGELVLLVGEDRIKAVGERAHLYSMLHGPLALGG